jgi:hypothetical protein
MEKKCYTEAAAAVEDYIANATGKRPSVLYFHLAQAYASAGDNQKAAEAIDRMMALPKACRDSMWNDYARGTAAFFRGDRAELDGAVESLGQKIDQGISKCAETSGKLTRSSHDEMECLGSPIGNTMNEDILRSAQLCFDKPYGYFMDSPEVPTECRPKPKVPGGKTGR